MEVLRSRNPCDKQGRDHNKQGRNHRASDMLVWLKTLALDPCNLEASKDSVQQLWNQRTLKLRKFIFLSNAECPWRKRKLEQFLKKGSKAASGLALVESNNQNIKKLNRGQPFVSCLHNLADAIECGNQHSVHYSWGLGNILTFEDSFQGKEVNTNIKSQENASKRGPSCKDFSHLVEKDELVNGSNLVTPENLTVQDATLEDFGNSVHSSDSSSSEESNRTSRLSLKLRVETVELPSRPVIPIGPSFQAELPECTGQVNKEISYGGGGDGDSEDSRWLGTRIWPNKGRKKGTALKAVGKGRPDSCSCASPGSVECVELHILEARRLLQCDIGPAFFSWKFDETGEAVSKSWTLKEQQKFAYLVKVHSPSNVADFWECVLKRFPSKSQKSIMSYYYNVFVPKRMSLQTRSSLEEVDSTDDDDDDDDEDEDEGTGSEKRCNANSNRLGSSKGKQIRYLQSQ